MKCPVCQNESPEGKKFCAECGAELPQPEQTQEEQPIVAVSTEPKPMWFSAHWKGLVAVAIVLVVVLASVGLIYTQPWSKIKVLVYNQNSTATFCAIYIDGNEKFRGEIPAKGGGIMGVWPVSTGHHEVAVDASYLGALGSDLDGVMDYDYEYQVGPLYTKDVYVYVSPEEPDLVEDLSFTYSTYSDTITVEGKVFNYGLPTCLGTLHVTLQDSRGWSRTDTIELGAVDGGGGYVDVYRSYGWPSYFDGQSNYNVVPQVSHYITFT